jgi:ATP-dependent helicase/nuclease subunit A
VPGGPPLWAFRAAETRVPTIDTLKTALAQRQREEHHRLLYVAMTRAGERLYIGGYHGKRPPRPGNWHDLVGAGLRAIGEQFPFPSSAASGLRLERGHPSDPPLQATTPPARRAVPPWASRPAPTETVPPRPLMPSRPDDEDDVAARTAQGGWAEPAALSPRAGRFRRGTLLHRLLQRLPDVPVVQRPAFALAWLAREAADLDVAIRAGWADEAVAVLELPDAAGLFSPGSRAEAPVVGMVDTPAGRLAISGQIDRLAITADAVLFADIKTNRPPPSRVEDVPRVYRRQLALYRALLAGLYPDRPVRGFLLWTDGPRLMEVPAALLDPPRAPS